jgi:hypothetical protein
MGESGHGLGVDIPTARIVPVIVLVSPVVIMRDSD